MKEIRSRTILNRSIPTKVYTIGEQISRRSKIRFRIRCRSRRKIRRRIRRRIRISFQEVQPFTKKKTPPPYLPPAPHHAPAPKPTPFTDKVKD